MAHPKGRTSKARKNKRRGHLKLSEKTIAVCPTTEEVHLYHRAYVVDGNLYYKGKLVIENFKTLD